MNVQKKHPLSIRWNHWINFPLLCIMTWSGLCIYWANPEYGLSPKVPEALGLQYKLAIGLAWHWPFAILFTINGILYILFLFFTGHWRYVLPKIQDFKQAPLVAAHDLKLTKKAPPIDGKYNSAQKLAYFSISILGAVMVLTGFAIYKPTQLSWLLRLCGGYTVARYIHLYITLALVLFFIIHLLQVLRAGWNPFRAMITGIEVVTDDEKNS